VNHTRFPKEDHLPDWACRDNQVKKGGRVDLFLRAPQPNEIKNWSCHHVQWRRQIADRLDRGICRLESCSMKLAVIYIYMYVCVCVCVCGPGSSVGIATDYGLDGPGIKSRWGRDFPLVQTAPGAHPASCTMGTGSFPGVKCGRGVTLTTHPLLAPRSWKGRAIPLLPSGPQPGL
jgi:hypothetical protein